MPKLLPIALLLAVSLPVRAAERLLTPPAFAALRAYHSTPAVATDGTSYLAAWIDQPYTRTPSLKLQRLDAAATTLPAALVTDQRLSFGRVDLAWSNESYLVVWNEGFELHSMRVGRDGVPVGGSDRILGSDLADAAIASRGAASLVVAHTNYIENEVVVLALDAADNVVRRTTIGSYAGALYDVAARDGGFTVALSDLPGLSAFRYDAAGAPLGAAVTVMRSRSVGPFIYRPISVAVAGRGADTLIVWTAQAAQQPLDLFAAILSPAGAPGAPVPLPHSGRYTGAYLAGVDAAGDDAGYTVLFNDASDDPKSAGQLQSLRLNADGTPASTPRPVTTGATFTYSARLTRGSSGYGLVWIANDGTSPSPSASDRVQGAVAADAANVAPLLLSRAVTEQSGPSIASNGSGYLAAWLEQSQERDQIFAMPLDHNGAPASGPLLLFERRAPSYPGPPRVAFSGGTYLVAWLGDGALQAMRLDAAGRPLDPQPLALSGPLNDPQFDVAPTPAGFFVVWQQGGSIYGAALTGPVPAAPQKLTEHLPRPAQSQGVYESEPHIAFNGAKFLLAYTATLVYVCVDLPCGTQTTWQMIRLDASGRRETEPHPLDAAPLDVASDGRDFALIGWDDVLRIDAQTLAVTARVFVPSDRTPALLWNGTRYVAVTTLDEGAGAARVTAREIAPAWTLGSARVAEIEPRFGSFDAAVNAAGDVVIAYSRSIAEEPFEGATRVAVQTVGDVAPARRPVAKRP